MSIMNDTIGSGIVTRPASIKVWDPFVRVFHWSLATLFLVAYLTAEDIKRVHMAAGFTIAALVALRIVWGFVGPAHARFGNFVRPPREILAYLRDVASRRAPRYLGHNPAGGAMIVTLLIMLIGASVTGAMMTTDAFWGVKWVGGVHEAFANLTVGLVVFHLLGVVISSFEHRDNLVKSMITGHKRHR